MATKRKKRKRRKQPPKRYAKIISKMKEKGTFDGRKILYEPKGEVKMSEVMIDFIDPYTTHTETYDAYNKLVMLAIMAWNAALLPRNERKTLLDRSISKMPISRTEKKELRRLLGVLIERKDKHFADYTRTIMDYQITETKNNFHLSIASSLAIDEKEPES